MEISTYCTERVKALGRLKHIKRQCTRRQSSVDDCVLNASHILAIDGIRTHVIGHLVNGKHGIKNTSSYDRKVKSP